jgi:hypothetical protein
VEVQNLDLSGLSDYQSAHREKREEKIAPPRAWCRKYRQLFTFSPTHLVSAPQTVLSFYWKLMTIPPEDTLIIIPDLQRAGNHRHPDSGYP